MSTHLMAELEPIIPDQHLSGGALAPPEQGSYDPTPKSTALLPEGHNLLPLPPFELGSGADAPRPFARLHSFLATRFLHFVGLPTAFQEPNSTYSHATLRRVFSYLVERWSFRLVLCCVILAISLGQLLSEAVNPAVIIQAGETMTRAEHPDNVTLTTPTTNTFTNNSVRRLFRRRTLTALYSPPHRTA